MRLRHNRGAVDARSRYARSAIEVRSWCGRGTLVVHFRYAHRCGSGSVRYFNFLSGGTVYVYLSAHMAFWSRVAPQPSMMSTQCTNVHQLNEVAQYKTACSWSLLLLHNTVDGVLWAGETRAGYHIFLVIFHFVMKFLMLNPLHFILFSLTICKLS